MPASSNIQGRQIRGGDLEPVVIVRSLTLADTNANIQVDDANNDGVLDASEFCTGSMTGLVIIIRNGEGVYDGMCGTGNFFGTYAKDCPGTYETWNYGMYLYLDDCSTPVENSSWGAIKSLYQ